MSWMYPMLKQHKNQIIPDTIWQKYISSVHIWNNVQTNIECLTEAQEIQRSFFPFLKKIVITVNKMEVRQINVLCKHGSQVPIYGNQLHLKSANKKLCFLIKLSLSPSLYYPTRGNPWKLPHSSTQIAFSQRASTSRKMCWVEAVVSINWPLIGRLEGFYPRHLRNNENQNH